MLGIDYDFRYRSAVVLWNIALDQDAGPTNGGCQDCRGVVTVDTVTARVDYNVEYYVLGHASKFVAPGARRIASTSYGPGGIETVAFANPDGTRVLIVLNSGADAATFAVRPSSKASFCHRLPAGAVATFTWV